MGISDGQQNCKPYMTNLWEDCFNSRTRLFWIAHFQLEVLGDEIPQEVLSGISKWAQRKNGEEQTWMSECSASLIPSCEQISDSLLSLAMASDTDSMRGNVFLRVFGGGLRSRSGLNVARVVSGEKYRWMRWPLTEVRLQIQGIRKYKNIARIQLSFIQCCCRLGNPVLSKWVQNNKPCSEKTFPERNVAQRWTCHLWRSQMLKRFTSEPPLLELRIIGFQKQSFRNSVRRRKSSYWTVGSDPMYRRRPTTSKLCFSSWVTHCPIT